MILVQSVVWWDNYSSHWGSTKIFKSNFWGPSFKFRFSSLNGPQQKIFPLGARALGWRLSRFSILRWLKKGQNLAIGIRPFVQRHPVRHQTRQNYYPGPVFPFRSRWSRARKLFLQGQPCCLWKQMAGTPGRMLVCLWWLWTLLLGPDHLGVDESNPTLVGVPVPLGVGASTEGRKVNGNAPLAGLSRFRTQI